MQTNKLTPFTQQTNRIDLVFESVGGVVFDTCVKNIARFGKIVVVGQISGYTGGSGSAATKGLTASALSVNK